MDQAEINRRMERWGDAQIRRFQFRLGLFQRRGRTEREAEKLADYLAFRDQDKDDRRCCLECQNLRPQMRCVHQHAVLLDVPQRCQHFAFEMPET